MQYEDTTVANRNLRIHRDSRKFLFCLYNRHARGLIRHGQRLVPLRHTHPGLSIRQSGAAASLSNVGFLVGWQGAEQGRDGGNGGERRAVRQRGFGSEASWMAF
jgi:hypothetical protein